MADYKKIQCAHGVEISYVEFGQENEEVLIMGGYYFITFVPMLKALAKKYHVFGVVMRLDDKQPVSERAGDGLPNWKKQWVIDFYEFIKAIGITKFTYLGKCHGTFPFWDLMEQHGDMVTTAILLSPVSGGPTAAFLAQQRLMMTDSIKAFVEQIVRKPENIEKKIQEMMSVDSRAIGITPHQFGLEGKSDGEMKAIFQSIKIPVLIISASEDSMLDFAFLQLLYSNIKGCKVVLFEGEKHLFEMDIPEKIADEVFLFVDQVGKDC
jgi:pimeloyl-ACP methyl ester carboxylesterase